MRNFLELKFLVDDFTDLIESSMFVNASLPEVYYLLKWIGDSNMKKKPTFSEITFIPFPYTDDLN